MTNCTCKYLDLGLVIYLLQWKFENSFLIVKILSDISTEIIRLKLSCNAIQILCMGFPSGFTLLNLHHNKSEHVK